MLRSVLAVVAGYVLMAVLVMAAGLVLGKLFPEVFVSPGGAPRVPGIGWYALNLGYSFVFALAGGHTCARLARRAELAHAGALAGLLALMGLGSIVTYADMAPVPAWWTAGQVTVGVLGVLCGGSLRAQAAAAKAAQA